jgi:hypothetical protein
MIDPLILAAQARPVIASLHQRNDTVLRFSTKKSGYVEDELDAGAEDEGGHFRIDKKVMILDLDRLTKNEVESLATVEDFRKHPILAGVAAHQSAHARWSLWGTTEGDEFPETIPNPDYDEAHVHDASCDPKLCSGDGVTATAPHKWGDPDGGQCATCIETITEPDGTIVVGPKLNPALGSTLPKCNHGIESFPVKPGGQLAEVAKMLEEPRVERLGTNNFTKTWQRGMQLGAGHLVMEGVEEDDAADKDPLDAALGLAIRVGGRLAAGTLGTSMESRATVKRILGSVQKVMETALPDADDPYHSVMGLINKQVFSNEHTAPIPHLEAARQILAILHPENQDNPDEPGDGDGEGQGEGSGAGAAAAILAGSPGEGDPEGEGESPSVSDGDESTEKPEKTPEQQQAEEDMKAALSEAFADAMDGLDALNDELSKEKIIDEDTPESKKQEQGGHGAVVYNDPQAPEVHHHEQPTKEDQELFRRARDWFWAQIEPTVTKADVSTWMPGGGARLNVRQWIKDNLNGNVGPQRRDWEREIESVKPAPPVKQAIMLDGSGSMSSYARKSAAIAWATANAAADLPESRTVSVIYGPAAAVTQLPGHNPARDLAVSNTDGGWENFIHASQIVEQALWLDDQVEEGQPENVFILIVSDLQYGRAGQGPAFLRITKDWAERGYRIMVAGAAANRSVGGVTIGSIDWIELVAMDDLFKQ